jgi:RNA polymerase sigma-70 factor (ECF subfamily)
VRAELVVAESVHLPYERAYDRHAKDVFRFALAWTNDWAAAEDLTQEAFLRLWTHRASIDWDRPILGWLGVTTRRLASNRLRGLRRSMAVLIRPERQIDDAGRAEWLDVRQALGRLTTVERTALLLTTIEGWSYAELAAALQTSPGALRAAVSRARQKLETASA